METFTLEFDLGEIVRRDKWQFELKSEFLHSTQLEKNTYKQEFYFFIPSALQVNEDSYSKKQFYRDQTNLIRYKTPIFTVEELLDPDNPLSPIVRITNASKYEAMHPIEDELKLFANIVRSLLRKRVGEILRSIKTGNQTIGDEVHKLCQDVVKIRKSFNALELAVNHFGENEPLHTYFYYTDEFINNAICFYLTGLLEKIPLESAKQELSKIIIEETLYGDLALTKPKTKPNIEMEKEFVFYRRGLLNKFILDALLLNTSRQMVLKRYSNIIGAIAAAIAMLVFFTLFLWQGNVLIINSMPFIIITVLLYVLKDRLKEGIRNISYQHFHRWFPDFQTEIRSPDGKHRLGKIEESFSFIREDFLPKEIIKIRQREFHAVLEGIKRPEKVIYYKRRITLLHPPEGGDVRRLAINLILRFNVSQFIHKADNPFHYHLKLNPETGKIIKMRLPKVYHLNVILKNSYSDENGNDQIEFKKFRLILDKNGIKRVEQLKAPRT